MQSILSVLKFVLIFIIILVFSGCSSENMNFEVILETNIDSGYEWNSKSSDNVNLVSNMNFIDDNNDNLENEGVSIFSFEVVSSENIILEFNYCNQTNCLYKIKYEIENKNNKLKLLNKEGTYFEDKIIPDPSFI